LEGLMLEIIVFIAGAGVMALEMVGARVLAPWLGTSIVVWTSLIGVILASMSLGYWLGGRVADRNPSPRVLAKILLGAALFVALTAAYKSFILALLLNNEDARLPAMLAALALFAPPGALLGMVAPFAVRLKMRDVDSSGRTAGNLYALSTLGSILGVLLTGFVLIAYFGTTPILYGLAGLFTLCSLLAWREKPTVAVAILALTGILAFASHSYERYLAGLGIHDVETPYSRVLVCDSEDPSTRRPIRVMTTNFQRVQSARYIDQPEDSPASRDLVLDYTRFFALYERFVPDAQSVLLLGGGGYSFPTYALGRDPKLRMLAVELDPGVTALARQYFGLKEDPRLRIVHGDARTYLNRATETFDTILVDVFTAHYAVPFHLATVETAQRLSALLNERGVCLVNTIAAPVGEKSAFLWAAYATLAQAFPEVRVYPLQGANEKVQNVMLVGFKDKALRDPEPSNAAEAAFLNAHWTRPLPALPPPLRDEFAPVDRYVASLWRE
jgi:spermidine synthase